MQACVFTFNYFVLVWSWIERTRNNIMNSYLEAELSRHQIALARILEEFKQSLSNHELEMLSEMISVAEIRVEEQRACCVAGFEEALAGIQIRRQENPQRSTLFDRAEQSLQNQLDSSLKAIESLWSEAIRSYRELISS